MSSIVVSELEYAPPGADSLFFDVSFGVAPGEKAAIVGANGVGKSTILRILSGVLEADEGEFALGGTVLTMTQDVGMSRPTDTLREMLVEVAPPELRDAGRALIVAERAMLDGSDDGMKFAEAITHWGDMGGYELESQWAAAAKRSVKTDVDDFGTRSPMTTWGIPAAPMRVESVVVALIVRVLPRCGCGRRSSPRRS